LEVGATTGAKKVGPCLFGATTPPKA